MSFFFVCEKCIFAHAHVLEKTALPQRVSGIIHPSFCQHTHVLTGLHVLPCTVCNVKCQKCLWLWLLDEFLDSVPGAVWMFMWVFMTNGSGNGDIWFPSQSEDYLIVWVWSDKRGGLQYILTSTWEKETEQAVRGKQRRRRSCKRIELSTRRH